MNRITTHPGDVLKEELEARGISQKKFSEVLSIPYTQLNEILNGKRPVTTDLASTPNCSSICRHAIICR